MKIGLYSGSFNPIHNGHLALANYILMHTDLDEIWLVVSPHNPLKEKENLIDDRMRLQMATLAVNGLQGLKVSDVEFFLPKPSYTIQTLKFLSGKYPDDEFVLIIGADNLDVFHLWRDYKEILANYRIIVYPRRGSETKPEGIFSCVDYIDAPLFDISSTGIREKLVNGEDISTFLPERVFDFIMANKLYLSR